jgi:hypothetical protein
MPAVYYDLLVQAFARLSGAANQVLFWSRLSGWTNQTLTPNPDCIYFIAFFNTADVGPVVLEIPPAEGGSITGSIDDCWQAALEDVGPAGVDKGAGGRYLILPPDHGGAVPDGYIALASQTYQGFALLRSNLADTSEATVAAAVEYGKRVRLYPLAQADDPGPTVFVDAVDTVFDTTIPYDHRLYESLNRIVQAEPWIQRDRAMIDMLDTLGIRKGATFAVDESLRVVLADAAREARAWLDERYEAGFAQPYFEGTHWAVPVTPEVIQGQSTVFADVDSYPVADRGVMYTMAFFSARHLGAGQFYVMTVNDREGRPFDGSRSYRLTVPANAPVTLYWSATVYDRSTHALLRDQLRVSCASNDNGVKRNPDGSVDVYLGPTPPSAGESNWVPTLPDGKFEVLFRLYGPQPPLFDKTWRLPDIEEVPA